MADDGVRIEEATWVDDELLEAFQLLIPQLSSSNPPPDAATLEAIVNGTETILLIARDELDGGRIVGSLTLALFQIPTALRAWIEDVVVDTAVRGRGIGEKLNLVALERAAAAGAATVDLTSRPKRESANRLYQRMGFIRRDTNVYRFAFD